MTKVECFERDNLVVEELRRHRGADNAISSHDLCEFLAACGYETKTRYIGSLVNRIMVERGLPICYINGKGYYWASKPSEIKATISDLQSRINSLNEHIEHLKCFIMED